MKNSFENTNRTVPMQAVPCAVSQNHRLAQENETNATRKNQGLDNKHLPTQQQLKQQPHDSSNSRKGDRSQLPLKKRCLRKMMNESQTKCYTDESSMPPPTKLRRLVASCWKDDDHFAAETTQLQIASTPNWKEITKRPPSSGPYCYEEQYAANSRAWSDPHVNETSPTANALLELPKKKKRMKELLTKNNEWPRNRLDTIALASTPTTESTSPNSTLKTTILHDASLSAVRSDSKQHGYDSLSYSTEDTEQTRMLTTLKKTIMPQSKHVKLDVDDGDDELLEMEALTDSTTSGAENIVNSLLSVTPSPDPLQQRKHNKYHMLIPKDVCASGHGDGNEMQKRRHALFRSSICYPTPLRRSTAVAISTMKQAPRVKTEVQGEPILCKALSNADPPVHNYKIRERRASRRTFKAKCTTNETGEYFKFQQLHPRFVEAHEAEEDLQLQQIIPGFVQVTVAPNNKQQLRHPTSFSTSPVRPSRLNFVPTTLDGDGNVVHGASSFHRLRGHQLNQFTNIKTPLPANSSAVPPILKRYVYQAHQTTPKVEDRPLQPGAIALSAEFNLNFAKDSQPAATKITPSEVTQSGTTHVTPISPNALQYTALYEANHQQASALFNRDHALFIPMQSGRMASAFAPGLQITSPRSQKREL